MGIRELKNRLSEYIRMVRAGETVTITDRGTVVAELHPPGAPSSVAKIPAGLLRLAREGKATLGEPNDPSVYKMPAKPVLEGITSEELLDQERGER